MRTSRVVVAGLVGMVAISLAKPGPAAALDIASYVSATAGGGIAIAGAVMNANGNASGKTMLTAGLAVSAGCSTVGLLLDLFALSAVGSLDRVEQLQAEVAAGGGPVIDAYAAGLGLTRDETLAAVRASGEAVPVADEADAQRFLQDLRGRLIPRARIGEQDAGRILYGLYTERGLPAGSAPWHDVLAELSGVPVATLAPAIDGPIDARLAAAAAPGEIVSARSVLAHDSLTTLNAVLDRIVAEDGEAIDAHTLELARLANPSTGTR